MEPFISLVLVASGVFIAGLCVPLWLGRVGPNAWYGMRSRRAFASRENWFAINHHGGRVFTFGALALALFGLGTLVLPARQMPGFEWIALAATVLAIGIPTLLNVRFERSLRIDSATELHERRASFANRQFLERGLMRSGESFERGL